MIRSRSSTRCRPAISGSVAAVLLILAGANPPVARGDDASRAPDPRECIAEVDGLFPYGATGGRNAVLLVHGWTGRPDGAWLEPIDKVVSPLNRPVGRSFADELKALGDTDVWLIDYHEDSFRWVTDERIAGPIGAAIDCLHDRYRTPIAYAAHSMGGLALRAVVEGRQSKIGPVVTFGTPHLGSGIASTFLALLDVIEEVAAVFGSSIEATPDPLRDLFAQHAILPYLVEGFLDWMQSCGEDPFAPPCDVLPAFAAAVYSEAGLALLKGSPELSGSGGEALPRLPTDMDDRVLSLAGEVSLGGRQPPFRPGPRDPTGIPVSDDGVVLIAGPGGEGSSVTVRMGDWIVSRDSALGAFPGGAGITAYFDCQFYFVPDPVTVGLRLVGIEGRSSTRPVSEAFRSACAHWGLTSAREPTQFALGFISEHLGPGGPPGSSDSPPPSQSGGSSWGDPAPVVVVLDTSSSMTDPDSQGVVRMEGARSALRGLVESLPPTTEFALRQYPYLSGSDCDAGRAVIPLAPLDVGRVTGELSRVQPYGNTPTGPALRATVDDLRLKGHDSGQIVLISDGESNCGEPACEVAESIVAQGFDITVNTLGFLVSGDGRRELECIAAATGGLALTATDAEQLQDQLIRLGSAQLAISFGAPEQVRSGSRLDVEVTVANEGGAEARDVHLALVARGESFSPVLPPRFMVGNIPPGEVVSRRWSIATDGASVAGGSSSIELTATSGAADVAPVRARVSVQLDDDPLSVGDSGGIIRDVLGVSSPSVALLGDGFSAGASDRRLDADSDECADGTGGFGAILYGTEVDNFACFGALISDVIRTPTGAAFPLSRPSQIDALSRMEESPELVFLTIGMADAGILHLLAACATGRTPPWGGGSGDVGAAAECEVDGDLLRASLERVENLLLQPYALDDVYRRVAQETKDGGTLVVLAYPKLFSESTPSCARISPELSRLADHLIAELNNVVERAVDSARGTSGYDIRFVRGTAGAYLPANTGCDDDPFALMPTATDGAMLGGEVSLFHPTAEGQEALAAEVIRWSQTDAAAVLDVQGSRRETAGEPGRPLQEARGLAGEIVVEAEDLEASPVRTVRLDEVHRVLAEGFAPNSLVEIRMESRPILIGQSIVDEDGRLDVVVPVPDDISFGRHALRVSGVSPAGASVTLVAGLDVRPPRPGWVGFALPAVAALGVGGLGLALSLWRSGRRRPARSGGS